jgi:hypothetical protein
MQGDSLVDLESPVADTIGGGEAVRLVKVDTTESPHADAPASVRDLAAAASSITRAVPMFFVRDMRATVRWYESIGFTIRNRYEDDGELVFAEVSFGKGEFSLSSGGDPGPRDVRLWFFTDRVEELYRLFKDRQLRSAHAALLAASSDEADIRFAEDLYIPFYGGRQFSIRDINNLTLIFWQPEWLGAASAEISSELR